MNKKEIELHNKSLCENLTQNDSIAVFVIAMRGDNIFSVHDNNAPLESIIDVLEQTLQRHKLKLKSLN